MLWIVHGGIGLLIRHGWQVVVQWDFTINDNKVVEVTKEIMGPLGDIHLLHGDVQWTSSTFSKVTFASSSTSSATLFSITSTNINIQHQHTAWLSFITTWNEHRKFRDSFFPCRWPPWWSCPSCRWPPPPPCQRPWPSCHPTSTTSSCNHNEMLSTIADPKRMIHQTAIRYQLLLLCTCSWKRLEISLFEIKFSTDIFFEKSKRDNWTI